MIKERIDEFYVKKNYERDREHFYITDAGRCARAVYFQFKKYPKKEMEARILRLMSHGDYTHMRIMSVLFSLGLVKAAEIEIPKQEIVNGRADAIVSLKNEIYILEIKSINRTKFAVLKQPDLDHIKQVQLYLHYFNIAKGILLYECKDTQDIKEFFLDYDKELVNKLLNSFDKLKKEIDENKIPEIPEDLEAWKCGYCPYLEECKKHGGPKKKDSSRYKEREVQSILEQ